MKTHFKSYRAVTMIELLMVMAIISIMTTVGIASWQSSQADAKLRTAQREVAATVKLAQSYALQGKMQDDGSGNMVTPCGYGFMFTSSTAYQIFYNLPPAGTDCRTYNSSASDRTYIAGKSKTIGSSLGSGITMTSAVTLGTVYYTTPFANVFALDGTPYDSTHTKKQLFFSYGSSAKNIIIDYGGDVIESD